MQCLAVWEPVARGGPCSERENQLDREPRNTMMSKREEMWTSSHEGTGRPATPMINNRACVMPQRPSHKTHNQVMPRATRLLFYIHNDNVFVFLLPDSVDLS